VPFKKDVVQLGAAPVIGWPRISFVVREKRIGRKNSGFGLGATSQKKFEGRIRPSLFKNPESFISSTGGGIPSGTSQAPIRPKRRPKEEEKTHLGGGASGSQGNGL